MSDMPRLTPSPTEIQKLHLSAMILSGVIGLFVSYWTIYGLHLLIEIFAAAVSHTTWSWALVGLFGFLIGGYSVVRVYAELSEYVDR